MSKIILFDYTHEGIRVMARNFDTGEILPFYGPFDKECNLPLTLLKIGDIPLSHLIHPLVHSSLEKEVYCGPIPQIFFAELGGGMAGA